MEFAGELLAQLERDFRPPAPWSGPGELPAQGAPAGEAAPGEAAPRRGGREPRCSLVLHNLPLNIITWPRAGVVELDRIFRDFGALRERNKVPSIVIRPMQCSAFINFAHPEGAALALANLYNHERYRLITPAFVQYAKSNGGERKTLKQDAPE